jgi:hypothetical protein
MDRLTVRTSQKTTIPLRIPDKIEVNMPDLETAITRPNEKQ